jgi:hypothetical protein
MIECDEAAARRLAVSRAVTPVDPMLIAAEVVHGAEIYFYAAEDLIARKRMLRMNRSSLDVVRLRRVTAQAGVSDLLDKAFAEVSR